MRGRRLVDEDLIGERVLASTFDAMSSRPRHLHLVPEPLNLKKYRDWNAEAIVADGLSVSAADWTLHRATQLGIPVFGHGGTGAYGYQTGASFVSLSLEPVEGEHFGVDSYISGARCLDSEGELIEGHAPVSVMLDYDPQDLADGVDTLVEAAVEDLLQP